ncbi:MAG: DUF3987 domain-containing protein [Myxococcales bacterium]|nr:DUF3987 domain-containing protein [Myxococcales bacterium]
MTADEQHDFPDDLYPGALASLLIPLVARRKFPREEEWGKRAIERYENGSDRETHLEKIKGHVKFGGNVGLVVPPGVVVLDADTPEAVAWLKAALPDAPHQESSPGHAHFVCRTPPGVRFSNRVKVEIIPGVAVDVRSLGSQIVVEPSIHPSGSLYTWKQGLPEHLSDLDLPPPMILTAISSVAVTEKPNEAATGGEKKITAGSRNQSLASLAGSMRRRGMTRESIEAALREENSRRCDPPLPDVEVVNIARSIARYDADEDVAEPTQSFASYTPYTPPEDVATAWPEPLSDVAFHGLAGDFCHLIEPHTEADPAALLIQTLAEYGNVIGRSAYFSAEADRHFMNTFAILVGPTSKGRKGTSHGQVHRQFKAIDEEWANQRTMSGLSSGEGLIWQVRDPITKSEPVKEKGRVVDYQDVQVDAGVDDKRLFVVEPEFSMTLRVMGREGNTLSAIIRQAWDAGNLRTLVKNSPAQATNAHISIVGHVTKDELIRYLDRTEAGNGFANRFLWICVRRSKVLPEGGALGSVDFAPLIRRLAEAVSEARGRGELRRDAEARKLWFEVYEHLSEGRPGLLGAVTSRSEAQVMRLACIYALLDRAQEIGRWHLEAALEVWRYAFESAAHIFGNALGDPKADAALSLVRSAHDGISRSELGQQLFGKHARAEQLVQVLEVLRKSGLAEPRTERTGGRPTERWFATHRGGYGVYGAKGSDQRDPGPAFTPYTPYPPSGCETKTEPEPEDLEEAIV